MLIISPAILQPSLPAAASWQFFNLKPIKLSLKITSTMCLYLESTVGLLFLNLCIIHLPLVAPVIYPQTMKPSSFLQDSWYFHSNEASDDLLTAIFLSCVGKVNFWQSIDNKIQTIRYLKTARSDQHLHVESCSISIWNMLPHEWCLSYPYTY